MFSFDPNFQSFSSNRYCLASSKGMVATSNALASAAGIEILRMGGNAVDAAIATAACLTVVEPTANGIGSDNFALVWMKDQLYGMVSQGCSAQQISRDRVRSDYDRMPKYGWTPVTVPGTPAGWAALNQRFGRLSLLDCLMPAIRYAREGFPVAATVALAWQAAEKTYLSQREAHPELAHWFSCFNREGRSPEAFEYWTLPAHADSLELIGRSNSEAFYRGSLADRIDQQSREEGGYLRKEDLAAHKALFVRPLSVNYRGYDVYELPPSNQGLVALMGLNVMKNFSFTARDLDYYHKSFEAIKLSFADGKSYITDPAAMSVRPEDLISESYGRARAGLIRDFAQDFDAGSPLSSNTVYLATGDGEGNLVSMIQSNYMGFGSGVVVEGTGIALQNRGADFSLEEGHANVLAPGKKSYHTLIPGMIGKEGRIFTAFGVMGAYMQPQGHIQVASNLIDFGENPQMALDAPRWQWTEGKTFLVEDSFPTAVAESLIRRGHDVRKSLDRPSFGRGQIILRKPDGVLIGATESRTDGNIALY